MKPGTFSFSEAFGRAIQVYLEHFGLLLLLSFLISLLPLYIGIMHVLFPENASTIAFMLVPASFGTGVFFFMALINAQSKFFEGKQAAFKEVLLESWARIWRGIGGYVLFSVVAVPALCLFILPGLYWLTMFYFFIYVMVIEDRKLLASFSRNHELVQGCWWLILKAHALIFILGFTLLVPVIAGMHLLGTALLIRKVVTILAGLFLIPVFTGFYYQLYYFLRSRKDGTLKIHEHLAPRATP